MVEVDGVVRRWGNSFGILIPKETIARQGLRENARVHVVLVPASRVLKETFGMLKGKPRITGQQLKDLSRAELYD